MKKHAAPIIAAVLLLLPMLYVGSYLALVTPGRMRFTKAVNVGASTYQSTVIYETYRYGGVWSERLYWPLEQIDRKLRPGTWGRAIRIINVESVIRCKVYRPVSEQPNGQIDA